MAEPEVQLTEPDVEMAGAEEEGADVEEDGAAAGDESAPARTAATSPGTVFLDYLKSPMIEVVVGKGSEATTISAHQNILTQSPWFTEQVAALTGSRKRISMPDESLDAIACFLQYQYTGEYFPRRLPSTAEGLETDPSAPAIDDTGDQLLKHARVYTLAEKLGLPELKTLAHSKIHRINSTARGEIAYARYVYGNTPSKDVTIRKPVAAFWATRSHVLRHEAEEEFRTMCLEYPQFGFDVLSLVLDQKEKRSAAREEAEPGSAVKGSARKRARVQL
ncbi:MAG: hypothetical protein Q9227_006289 [Pyrenula ochraceoflavens]